MDSIIQSYLSSQYEIRTSDLGNDGIYTIVPPFRRIRPTKKNGYSERYAPFPHFKLTKELIVIFSIDEVSLISIINKWAKVQKQDVDLEFYWSEVEAYFPIADRITAHTIGMDLIPLQPLNLPEGKLMYFDYKFGK